MMNFDDLDLREIEANALVCVQHKDRQGLCIIPEEQVEAAEAFLARYNKKISLIEGSKRSEKLRFYFTPSATESELEEMEDFVEFDRE